MQFLCSYGQGISSNVQPSSPTTADSILQYEPKYGTLGILVGSSGIGLEFKREIADKTVLRFGYSHLPFSFTKVEQTGNVTINGYYKARFNNWHLLADYEVKTIKQTIFRLTGGISYFSKANVFAHVTPLGSYKYGEIELNDGTMGYADVDADWKGAGLYFGCGIGSAIPKSKMSYSFDLGTYYFTTSAKVSMVTTGYLAGNEVQRKQIQDNLKSYYWLPVIQLSLNYKL